MTTDDDHPEHGERVEVRRARPPGHVLYEMGVLAWHRAGEWVNEQGYWWFTDDTEWRRVDL